MSTADGAVVGRTQILSNGPASQRWNLVIMGDGYQASQLGQFANDAQAFVSTVLATAPLDRLQHAINVFRVDVTSTDSGADDPAACGGSGATARTYFDASFCNNGVQRLLEVNTTTALGVAATQVPQFHMAMVIVNSSVYGGSGGSVATFSLAPNAMEIGLHEMGHTAFGFADEYEYYAGCGVDVGHDNHPPTEPAEPNVTIDSNRNTIKWHDLVLPATPMPTTQNANCAQCDPQPSPMPPGTVGAFEGAHYYHCGAYRPEFNCRMRALNNPFCAVCQQVIERKLAPFLPSTWTAPVQVPGWFGWEDQGASVAVADISGNGRPDLLVFHIDNPGGENHGYYRIGWDIDANGVVNGGWTPPIVVPGWFGWDTQGGGIAIADLDGSGRPDVVIFHIDNPGGENHGYYRIGRNLDTHGNVTGGWTNPLPVPGWFGWENQAGSIAIADLNGNGRKDLIVFHVDNPSGENHGYLRVGRDIDANGAISGGWSGPNPVPGWFGAENQGGGVAVTDVDEDGTADVIVFHIDNPGGENHGYFRVGWRLDNNATVAGGWTTPLQVPGWFGWESQGGGIAVGDLDGNGRPELVVLHVDNPSGENHAYYRIGWNLLPSGQVGP